MHRKYQNAGACLNNLPKNDAAAEKFIVAVHNEMPNDGPFAKELYADLEQLQQDGLIAVDNDTDEDKTRITLADSQRAEAALAELPDDLREDVCAMLDEYGQLDHNRLLRTVYDKYPAYATKSRIRKKKGRK